MPKTAVMLTVVYIALVGIFGKFGIVLLVKVRFGKVYLC